MRLLLITDTYPPDINGVARTLSTLARGLAARGHVVEVVTTLAEEPGAASGSPGRHVMASMPLPGYPGLRIGFATTWQMQALFASFMPDALYVATETPLGIASIRAARKLGIPVVSGFHTNFQTYLEDYALPGLESVAQGLLRALHNQTARTLTPSADTAEMLEKWGVKNVGVLGRGVDTELFHPARRSADLRREWGAGEDAPVAVHVGRVAAEKNLDLLIRAFAAFREEQPGAPCVVVGDGPKLKWMQSAHPGILYAGTRTGEDLARHYASADVFIFPSTTETFGNVVLEALASGVPPVAFDYAGPRQLVKPGVNGWLAPFADDEAFLNQTRAAARAWNAAPMHEAARAAALELGWQRVIEQFEQELLSAPPAGPAASA